MQSLLTDGDLRRTYLATAYGETSPTVAEVLATPPQRSIAVLPGRRENNQHALEIPNE